MPLKGLKIKIFADGANKESILKSLENPWISGFTTNPTLMHKAGISDYEAFARDLLTQVKTHPISFEVFSDHFDEMKRQALKISEWQENVYVKIPITNSRGESSIPLIRELSKAQVKLNITAIMTLPQILATKEALHNSAPSLVSVYAGRIADTGRDPCPFMAEAVEILRSEPQLQLMWASSREVLNVFQADNVGCHIITLTHDHLQKFNLLGKDLGQYSLETVKMLHDAATTAGYVL